MTKTTMTKANRGSESECSTNTSSSPFTIAFHICFTCEIEISPNYSLGIKWENLLAMVSVSANGDPWTWQAWLSHWNHL